LAGPQPYLWHQSIGPKRLGGGPARLEMLQEKISKEKKKKIKLKRIKKYFYFYFYFLKYFLETILVRWAPNHSFGTEDRAAGPPNLKYFKKKFRKKEKNIFIFMF
jgi:hypothetical protein